MPNEQDQKKERRRRAKVMDEVVQEYPHLGKYRIRVLRKTNGNGPSITLDIREYISAESFEGFTRRGIRLGELDLVNQLRDTLADIVSKEWFQSPNLPKMS